MGYLDFMSWLFTPVSDSSPPAKAEVDSPDPKKIGAARNICAGCVACISQDELRDALARLRPAEPRKFQFEPESFVPGPNPFLQEIRMVLYKRNLKHFESMVRYYVFQ
jgi:hypothetical protein